MERKQNLYGMLVCGVALASCHSPAPKGTVQRVQKKDTVKAVAQTTASPKTADSFMILDTVAGRDTIKVVLYRDSMIRCSINNLSDTFNASVAVHGWDSSFGDDGLIVVPGNKKLKSFILNDSLLIIPMSYGYMFAFGGVSLVLLNRAKNSLKFAHGDRYNAMISSNSCPYVDLKNNLFMTYYYHPYYDFEDAGECQLDHARWQVYRYEIKNKKFMETYYVAASSKELDAIDVSAESDSAQMAFYAYMAHYKYWERDRFDSSIYQQVVILDTIAGKDTISVNYDNKGIITAILNRDTDTYDWERTWIGNEWWRGKEDCKMIVPGGKKPVSCILNDTILVVSLNDLYRYASLFVLKRYRDSLLFINDQISTSTNYLYVDLKKNTILTFGISGYSDSGATNAEKLKYPYEFDTYKIYNKYLVNTETGEFALHDKDAELPSSFAESRDLYEYLIKEGKKRDDKNTAPVIDFIKKYFFNWYFYYEQHLNRN